ncbi:hypothetical protein HWB51_gp051 [Mycobacterium phage Cuke]|uniref:Uncharacterized protein n=1 Tax=Mycobacterium phage Cuke TaxID=2079417 RepID=A0A2L1IWV2_9CAUD|nr:hypothetical protein HWB51_gp051 [Mycobacterium phage Cuke]AVD99669.1 hypothetical protein SEA_CUKE_51 [Mycobacterium phage Cuke]
MRPGTFHAPGLGEPLTGETKRILRSWKKKAESNRKWYEASKTKSDK